MFSKYRFYDLADSRDKQISDAIGKPSDDYILNVNEDEFIQYLIDEHTLYMPTIYFEDVRIEPRKVLVDQENLPRYWTVENAIECSIIRYIVPFSGDHNILYACPSTFILSGSNNFHVGFNEIYTDILGTAVER